MVARSIAVLSQKLAVAGMMLVAATFSHARPLDDVVKSGYLDIAVYEDFKPYSWSDNGMPRGIDVDIAVDFRRELTRD